MMPDIAGITVHRKHAVNQNRRLNFNCTNFKLKVFTQSV